MALHLCRSALGKAPTIGAFLGKHAGPVTVQSAGLKATWGEPYPYKEPFPYEEKSFGPIRQYFDKTVPRLCEQSKVIIVEGNVASGKRDFAQRLAKGFDLKYISPVADDFAFYWSLNGFDLRNLNSILSKEAQFYDLKAFLHDPNPEHGRLCRLLYRWYQIRFYRYCDALLHLLSTGQGVVVAKSAFTDLMFANVYRQMGYLTNKFYSYFQDMHRGTIVELKRPHLTIYLDTPVEQCMKNIKERKDPKEGKNLDAVMLSKIESAYKRDFLPLMEKSGAVMQIDCSAPVEENDMEVIIEEISTLNLEASNVDEIRFHDWFDQTKDNWTELRQMCASRDMQALCFRGQIPHWCPEFMNSPVDDEFMQNLVQNHPSLAYQAGYAPEYGHNPYLKL